MKEINKILVLGDSLSRGVLLDEKRKRYYFSDKCFFTFVKEKLSPLIKNLAKFGATTLHCQKNLEKNLNEYKPDLVLIEYGGNDCDFNWDEIAKTPGNEHLPAVPLKDFEDHLSEIVSKVKAFGAIPILMTLPPLVASDYFNWFTNGDKQKGEHIQEWLKGTWVIYYWQERYSSAVRHFATKNNLHLIDIRHAFLEHPDFRKLMCSDGIHPNEAGHQLIADEIIKYVSSNRKELIV